MLGLFIHLMLRNYGFLSLLLCASCSVFQPIPQPKREFRGFWVATVVNIDWPKKGTDPLEKQKQDYLDILGFYQDLNFNAAIVQVRTAGDAFYPSRYAPWSRFLTGTEGEAPTESGEMLEWMIQETHKRGMEFHAWVNPYRATFDLKTEILSPMHDFFLHPEWMVPYGKKYYYNPGLPEVRNRLVSVIDELVRKYPIDAIHFDDYFYPYKIKGEQFRDSSTYRAHALPGQSRDDWRRANVDSLVKQVHHSVASEKPWVQFGISPFGVWRNKDKDPKGSDTQAGQTNYDDLYANPLVWMEEGWLDYIVPQVYWSMDLEAASHKKVMEWWGGLPYPTNLYIGNGPYKIRNNSDAAWQRKKELPDQLKLARKTKTVQGNVFFSAKSLKDNNPDVVAHLQKKFYKWPALTPISPWTPLPLEKGVVLMATQRDSLNYYLHVRCEQEYPYALVYTSGARQKSNYPIKKILAKLPVSDSGQLVVPRRILKNKKYLALTLLDNFGRESMPKVIRLADVPDKQEPPISLERQIP
ncbi:MAG: family 10 glycosylhydrolase [Bacteroidota bacterium]